MSPSGDHRSVLSQQSQTTFLTNHSQFKTSLQQRLSSRRAPVQVSGIAPPSSNPGTSIQSRIHIPSFITRSKPATKDHSSPSQVLCKARSAILESKSELPNNHFLHKRIDKHNGSLKHVVPLPAPKCDHVFPPKPPKASLRGLSRTKQREHVGDPTREVDPSEAQLALQELQIKKLEFQLWEAREPRELAGLGTTFMGPSTKESTDTVERWVAARTLLKMGVKPDKETLQVFKKKKLILLHPGTGLPLDWEAKISNDGRPFFVELEAGKKQWEYPKGTDVRRFKRFWAEE